MSSLVSDSTRTVPLVLRAENVWKSYEDGAITVLRGVDLEAAQGETIAHGAGKGRVIAIGGDVFGEDATGACAEIGGFDGGRRHSRMDFAQDCGTRVVNGEGRHQFSVAFRGTAYGLASRT